MQFSAQASKTSSQAYQADDRNEHVLVHVNGEFVPRSQAVSYTHLTLPTNREV